MTSMADLVCGGGGTNRDKPALRDADGGCTFGELDAVSSRFAAYLVSRGVLTGDRIAFAAPKSVSLVAAILGCLKAGAIYVPIDSLAPAERIRMIIDDVVPRFVAADLALYDTITAGVRSACSPIEVDRLEEYCSTEPDATLPQLTAEDVAYCLYTSGSTGKPKGVLIQHGSVEAFFRALPEAMPIDATCRCMNTSGLHFDVHVMDLFFPLHRGATVHLTKPPLIADTLLELIERERITHFTAVGSVMTLLTEGMLFDRCDLSSLQRVMTGAEVLNIATVQRWLRKVPGLSLVNGYGPTEATVICTYHLIDRVEPKRSDPYSIGKPFGESEVFLMDNDSRLIDEPGVEGELLISGPQVMKGYWRDEATTDEKIVTAAGRRCYRSGDVCRRLPDGDLDYVGRRDEQIKLFGYRIELGEIKRVMDAAELVGEGQTVVATHPSLGKVIAACFTSDPPNGEVDQDTIFESLRVALKRELPYYMVPSLYCRFEHFPQLPSGKTDKRAILQAVDHYIRKVDSSATRFTAATQEATR
jgi:amino acid adenylation domain-containing protein